MEFSANNPTIKRCIRGMALEESGKTEEAGELFLQAWRGATDDFEKFMAAHFVARHQKDVAEKLRWSETALQLTLRVDSDAARSALPALYSNVAACYEDAGDPDNAKRNRELARQSVGQLPEKGPFYHGTRAALQVGDMLTPGGMSNYKPELVMNHIYFTALLSGAGLAAALAKGEGPERVYIVEPTGHFENDPNVTDKKFPGNPTQSFRSEAPLRVVGEVTDWSQLHPEDLQQWREKLARNKGEIIN